MKTQKLLKGALLAASTVLLAGCAVGPDYKKPAPTPTASPADFKEIQGWKAADPAPPAQRGAWWSIYNDATLNQLESQVALNNQNIATAAANYRAAKTLITQAQAGLFPNLGASFAASRSQSPGLNGRSAAGNNFSPSLDANWTVDLWGAIRRQTAEARQNAEVSKDDLAYAALSAQATLAADYMQLRSADALAALLQETVTADARALTITRNQYASGIVTRADVLSAQTTVDSARAQLAAVASSRAIYEHAIAVLMGQAPAALSVGATVLATQVPVVPAGVPSALLERRPDIAAAEHTMHAKNEAVGVAVAALYPTITLTASGGFTGNALNNLFNVANRIWSLGGTSALTIFDAGAQTAAVHEARANYDAAVATYRQTVLSAFQGVEDQLATLHALQNESALDDATVAAARQAMSVYLNQYRAGTVAYTSVITAQNALLSAQQAQLSTQTNRLLASVSLVENLGGGWEEVK